MRSLAGTDEAREASGGGGGMDELTCLEICAGAGGQAAFRLETVPGLSTKRFVGYRDQVLAELARLGYQADWQVLNACDFGVPQLRPRFILVALRPDAFRHFRWPILDGRPPTVGE